MTPVGRLLAHAGRMRVHPSLTAISCLLSFGLFAACAATPDEVASNEPSTPSSATPEAGTPKESPPIPSPTPSEADSGTGGSGGGGADAGPKEPVLPDLAPAKNLAIDQIAVFQGVKVPIMKDGQAHDPSAKVHPVVGRAGFVRVYVEPETGWTAAEVTARLTLVRPGGQPATYTTKLWVDQGSEESDLDTTLNIDFPASAIEADTSYSVELLVKPDGSNGSSSGARFPASGELPLAAWDTGEVFKVKLVPVYNNGKLPETGPEQLKLYEEELKALFPVRKVELSVREAYDYPGTVYAGGSGISSLLTAVTNLRQKDGAPDDVYYYGAFRATDTYSGYCAGGCTTGICHLVSSSTDTYSRACVGVGYKGASAAGTMAHELGHAHGLPHAPCGNVAGPDSNFPYYGGKIGVWGWDERDGTLVDPDTRDFMSYCNPSWISDYNFDKLIHRMKKVAEQTPSEVAGQQAEWQSAEVAPDGSLVFRDVVKLRRAPDAEPRAVVFERGGRDVAKATAQFYPYADQAGGTLLLPVRKDAWDAVRVENLAGRTVRALR